MISFFRKLSWWVQRRRKEDELREELQFHLDEEAEQRQAEGLAKDQARWAACRDLGNVILIQESTRAVWTWKFMEQLVQDLRYAFRQFIKSPGFTISAILSLMLGIGATTAIFSLVYGILLDPYPYKDVNRIAYLELLNMNGYYQPLPVKGGHFEVIRSASSVEDVFLQQPGAFKELTREDSHTVVNAGFYSPNFFGVMGVPPLLGRVFTPADAPGGNPAPVAVLGHHFWQGHYGARREVIGKTIELDHAPYMVIGVMPPRFTWFDSEVYLPAAPKADRQGLWMAFAKLKPGADHRAAESEFQALAGHFAKEDPNLYPQDIRVRITTLNDKVLGSSGGIIANLFAAAVVLLVIGCANVSILLLARGTARQHEFAVRSSVGASRGRLIRQLLTESVLLSLTGSALGVLAAYWALKVMPRVLPDNLLPHEVAIRLNVPVLLFGAVAAVITGILFGLPPALDVSRPRLASWLQSSGGKIAGNTRARRMHRLPIAGQVALTLLLLAGAGAASKAFLSKLHGLQGFDPNHVFRMELRLPEQSAGAKSQEYFRGLISEEESVRQAVAQTRGVVEAGFSPLWDPGVFGFQAKVEIKSKPTLSEAQAVLTRISPQLLSVLRIPLWRGRIFDSAEVQRQAHVAMVNRTFVKQYLGGLDPIGQSVHMPELKRVHTFVSSAGGLDCWLEVIGVVGDATNDDLDHPRVRPAVFLPVSLYPVPAELYARASGDPLTAIRSVTARISESGPNWVVTQAETLRSELDSLGWGRERLIAAIFTFYAGIALTLAAGGLYGVVSFAVTQRTRELGIRMALGARRGRVVRLVLGSTVAMVGVGVATGLMVSLMLGPIVSAWGGGRLSEPLNLLGASLILVIVAALACAFPAWRAASIDPMKVLRAE
jgi:predicted permease